MKEMKFIYQCMHKAAPWYLFVNLINIVFSYFIFLGLLLFSRYVVNFFVYGQKEFSILITYVVIYGIVLFVSKTITYLTTSIFNPLQEIKITKYMNRLIYVKCGEVDLECYQEQEFCDKYARAINDAPARVIEAKNLVTNGVTASLRFITIFGLFTKMSMVFIVTAVLFCLLSFLSMKKINNIFHEAYLKETPVNRKAEYINQLFRNPSYAKEIKLFRIQDFLTDKFIQSREQLADVKENVVRRLLRILFSANALSSVLRAFINIYVIYLIFHGKLTVGDFTVLRGGLDDEDTI